jgi:UDP-N-acetylmuramoyl-L-alanyl-D-glutamate--2,6-diaminopimelate ligase
MSATLATLLPQQPLPPMVASCVVNNLQLDSRRVQPGDGFIAVSGSSVDGRKFIDAAIHAGAVAVLSESTHASVSELAGVPIIGVPDLPHRVGEVASLFYGEPAKAMQFVAVTGTNGKSSTTWFLRDALVALGRPCGLVGTLGMTFADTALDTGLTTPDAITLQKGLAQFRQAGAEIVAIEASSHALEQGRLSGVPISIAVFTNLSRDHLDYHGDMDLYFAAKAKLFAREEVQLAVINRADERGRSLAKSLGEKMSLITFGDDQSDIRCLAWQANDKGMAFTLQTPNANVHCQVPLYGRFNLENLMAVAAVLHGMGVGADDMAPALQHVTTVPGRMQALRIEGLPESSPYVLVDFAHTPDGLEKALTAARDHFSSRLWVVVGCGGNRDAGKRPQMAAVAERLADRLVFTSDNPRFEPPQSILADMLQGVTARDEVQVLADRQEAIAYAIAHAGANDVIVIAGKGHERWQEVQGEKLPMDDVQLALDALRLRGGVQ